MTEVGDNKEKQMKRAMSNAELIDELKGIKEISKKMSQAYIEQVQLEQRATMSVDNIVVDNVESGQVDITNI